MDRDDFLDGIMHISEGFNSLKSLEIIGQTQLDEVGKKLLKSDLANEDKQRKHIHEMLRYQGMQSMLEYILKEIKAISKKEQK